jgi:hypothetical protein
MMVIDAHLTKDCNLRRVGKLRKTRITFMKHSIKSLICGFSLLVFLLMSSLSLKSFAITPWQTIVALAESPSKSQNTNASKTYTFKQLKWDDSSKLKGSQATATFYLPILKQWKYTGAKLRLIISHSPLLQDDSSLTLQINNEPVSTLLLNKTNAESGVWYIDIPASAFNGDWLALNFISSLRITADLCKDNDNPGNWAYISPDSALTINYAKIPFTMGLNQLPYPFIYKNQFEPSTSLLVLPQNFSATELESALRVMRALGAQLNYNYIDLSVTTVEALTEQQKQNNNLILLGRSEQLSSLRSYTKVTNQGQAPDTGVISLETSPWNQTNALLTITGETDLAVEKAAIAFSNPQFSKLANDKIALVPEAPKISKQEEQSHSKNNTPVTLKELGYEDQTALGMGLSSLSYTFSLPNNKMPENLILKTILSHSSFSKVDHSMLTVAINGVRQASTFLTSSNENNASWPITIPQNSLNPGKNTLTYTFDLHLPMVGDCAPRYNYEAWGVIHSTTSLTTKFSTLVPRISLGYFPLAFSDTTLIIIPDKLDIPQLNAFAQLALKLGALLGYEHPFFTVLSANKVDPSVLAKQSNILIGTTQNNPWITKAMAKSSFKIEGNKVILYDKKNKLSLVNNEPVAVVELMNSPWNYDKNTLLITGTYANNVASAMSLLTDDKLRPQLTGNVATLNAKGQLASFETRPDFAWSFRFGHGFAKRNLQALRSFISGNLMLSIFGLFFIIMIILTLVGVYIRRKKD